MRSRYFVLFFKIGRITTCWHADGNNPVQGRNGQCGSEKRVAGAMNLSRWRHYNVVDK